MSTFHIWEGIYSSFAEAGGNVDVFAEEPWVGRSTEKGKRIRSAARSAAFLPPATETHEYCIPVLAGLVQARRGQVRILEFGGSVGFTFHAIADALGDPEALEMHVVDNESICRAGREVFSGETRLEWHVRPPVGRKFDVVHCGSSIQYSPDWLGRVGELAALGPDFLVFDDLPAGEVPTFVSLQYYYGKKIPHWFFGVREFVDTVTRATGYRLCYRARFMGTFLGRRGPLPMENFPASHRLETACNLAFAGPGWMGG
jgi:putative methyltransferase (TIGR04325 family)